MGQIQQHADVHVNRILIGNKCDMVDRVRAHIHFSYPPVTDRPTRALQVVTNEEGQALADEYSPKMQYFETSAKQDTDVQTVRSVSASAARRIATRTREVTRGTD